MSVDTNKLMKIKQKAIYKRIYHIYFHLKMAIFSDKTNIN